MGNSLQSGAASVFDEKAASWDTEYRIGRAKTIAAEIRARSHLKGEGRVMDFGCGTGLIAFDLLDSVGSLTLVDNSEGMRSVLREKMRLLDTEGKCAVADSLFSPELENASFDFIYCSLVLHHLDDLEGTGRRFRDLLVEGGRLCVVDLTSEDGSYHRGEPDFHGHNGFDPEKLSALYAGLGFKERYRDVFFTDTRVVVDRPVRYSLFLLLMEKGREA